MLRRRLCAILDYRKVEYLTASREDMRQRANMRHRAKFRGDRSNRCWDMAIFRFLVTAAAAILDFQNSEFFKAQKGQEGQNVSQRQISRRSV